MNIWWDPGSAASTELSFTNYSKLSLLYLEALSQKSVISFI